jgi:hypothetical protein
MSVQEEVSEDFCVSFSYYSSPILFSTSEIGERDLTFIEVLWRGLAADGGLYVPKEIPVISSVTLEKWRFLDYNSLTFEVHCEHFTLERLFIIDCLLIDFSSLHYRR